METESLDFSSEMAKECQKFAKEFVKNIESGVNASVESADLQKKDAELETLNLDMVKITAEIENSEHEMKKLDAEKEKLLSAIKSVRERSHENSKACLRQATKMTNNLKAFKEIKERKQRLVKENADLKALLEKWQLSEVAMERARDDLYKAKQLKINEKIALEQKSSPEEILSREGEIERVEEKLIASLTTKKELEEELQQEMIYSKELEANETELKEDIQMEKNQINSMGISIDLLRQNIETKRIMEQRLLETVNSRIEAVIGSDDTQNPEEISNGRLHLEELNQKVAELREIYEVKLKELSEVDMKVCKSHGVLWMVKEDAKRQMERELKEAQDFIVAHEKEKEQSVREEQSTMRPNSAVFLSPDIDAFDRLKTRSIRSPSVSSTRMMEDTVPLNSCPVVNSTCDIGGSQYGEDTSFMSKSSI